MKLLDPLARLVIAHRGASGSFPENTLLALRRGLEAGADALELDLRLSSDGTPVVIHDPTVDRTTNGSGEVASFSAQALGELDAGAGEPVPTLVQVLETFPTTPLILEIKEQAVSRPALAAVRQCRAEKRTVAGSFHRSMLGPFRAAGLPTLASRPEVAAFWLASRVGVRGWSKPHAGFSVPEWSGRIRVVDARFLSMARRVNKPVHVWTVDDLETAQRLWAGGVSGIITNVPERFGLDRARFPRYDGKGPVG